MQVSLRFTYEAPPTLMNNGKSKLGSWQKSISLYKSKEFYEAAQLIQTIEDRSEEQELYLG